MRLAVIQAQRANDARGVRLRAALDHVRVQCKSARVSQLDWPHVVQWAQQREHNDQPLPAESP